MIRTPFLAAILLLGACGGGAEESNNSADAGGGSVVIEQQPDNLQDDQNNSVVPLQPTPSPAVSPAVSPTPIAAILPEGFRGRWGMTADDCDPARDDAKGLMTVTADALRFYESRAEVRRIVRAGPQRVTADLAFAGEGQSWSHRGDLALRDDGRTLIRATGGDEGVVRYTRCPAAPVA